MRKFFLNVWTNSEKIVQMILYSLIILTITVQIIARDIFRDPLMFTEELARFLFLWMVFLGIPWVTKEGMNICIDIAPKWMTHRNKAVFNIVVEILTIAMFVYLIYNSIVYIKFSWINPAPAMRISMGIVYLCLPIGGVFTIARSIERIVVHIVRLKKGDNFDEYVRITDIAKDNSEEGGEA